MTASVPSAHEPTHTGALLHEDVLPALRISVADAARALGEDPAGWRGVGERAPAEPSRVNSCALMYAKLIL